MTAKRVRKASIDKDIIKPIKRKLAKESAPVRRKISSMMSMVTGVGKAVEQMVGHTVGMVGARARAAGENLFALVVLGFLFASLVLVVWLSLLSCLFLYLVGIAWTALSAIAVITGINVLLLAFVLYLIYMHKKHLRSLMGFRRRR